MKIFLIISLLFIMSGCSTNILVSEPIVCEKNCKQACLVMEQDYKGFDDKLGCFCADK